MLRRFISLTLVIAVVFSMAVTGYAIGSGTVLPEKLEMVTISGAKDLFAPEVIAAARNVKNIPDGLEEILCDGWASCAESVNIYDMKIPYTALREYYYAILYDHPEYFYVKSGYSYSYGANDYVYDIYFVYTMDVNTIAEAKPVFDSKVAQIVADVNLDWPRVQKAAYLHDYIDTHFTYGGDVYDPYNMLVGGLGVCQAYALLYSVLLHEVGVPASFVRSDAMNHAWNIIQLENGNWYHVDATWDDPVGPDEAFVSHTYFIKSDAGITEVNHHDWDAAHVCEDTSFDDAFWTNSRIPFAPALTMVDNKPTSVLYGAVYGASDMFMWTADNQRTSVRVVDSANRLSLGTCNGYLVVNDRYNVYAKDMLNGTSTTLYSSTTSNKGFVLKDGVLRVLNSSNTVESVMPSLAPIAPPAPELKFRKANLTLESSIAINFFVDEACLEGLDDAYVKFTKGKTTWIQRDYETVTLDDGTACRVYVCENVNAAEMSTEIVATLYGEVNGELYQSDPRPYGVCTYAKNQLAKAGIDANLKTLLVDMLVYGAAAQMNFNFNLSNLATDVLTEDQLACATSTKPTLTRYANSTDHKTDLVRIKSASLIMENKVVINYKLDLGTYGNVNDLYLKVTYMDADNKKITQNLPITEKVKDLYNVPLSNLNPMQMRTICTAEIFSKSTNSCISNTVQYSIESYAAGVANGGDALANLVNKMMNYGDSVARFFKK